MVFKGENLVPRIIPISELKKTSEISEMCKGTSEPIFITKNGYGDMVIMSVETYEKYDYMSMVYRKISEAEKSIAEGRVKEALKSLDAARSKYGL